MEDSQKGLLQNCNVFFIDTNLSVRYNEHRNKTNLEQGGRIMTNVTKNLLNIRFGSSILFTPPACSK